MLFMVIERFKNRDPGPIYARLREQGRSMPDGLRYIDSWIEANFDRCFQLMECDDALLFQRWIMQWRDLMEFEIVPVSQSQAIRELFSCRKLGRNYLQGDCMSPDERSLLEALDGLLRSQAIRAQIDPIVELVKRKLASEPTAAMAWEPIPLSVYGEPLPAGIRSSWVFLLRSGAITGSERHPNSHQRMMSYRGAGDLQTGGEEKWQSNPLISDPSAPLEKRWISVPPNVWHQAVVADRDWVVVSFHTVDAQELIEERPAAEDAGRTHQRHYLTTEQYSMEKVNLREKLTQFSDQWKPKIVGDLNGQLVKLVKFQGPFVWHHHDQEDELFLVVKGRFRMEFRDRHVWLEEGEFLIVPHGVEHRPVADEEAHVLLFEPASTLNTGSVKNERTVEHLDKL